MRFEEAASLGTAIASACLALFWTLRIPASLTEPASKPVSVLVYRGSTATGTMVLQMLKLSVTPTPILIIRFKLITKQMWCSHIDHLLTKEL